MNTAQLVVVGYAALAVEGVLFYQALVEGSATALILAILVAAGVLVYFLKPHPMARKVVVVGMMVLPLVVFAGWYWGWDYYQERRLAAQAERVTVEWVKANVPEQWQREYRQQFPGASAGQIAVAWNLAQEQQVEAEKAKRQAAAKEAEEQARIAAQPRIGDRVWVPNNDDRYLSDRIAAGVVAYDGRSRLYGTIVDIARGRYAVRWDCGDCKGLHEIVWHYGSDLNLVRGK